MSAPIKRARDSSTETQRPTKLPRTSDEEDEKLQNFLKWCNENKFYISSKVCVERQRVCAQYGMVATEDIAAGELLFTIPRTSLLSPNTCAIAPLLREAEQELGTDSGWVPQLLALLYEYNNPQSSWRPYLDLVPDFTQLDLPMFWSKKEREDLLGGTGVEEAVSRDLELLETDFRSKTLPFMEKHPQTFSLACRSLELYTKMVAFVMAYSFFEPAANSDNNDDDSDTEEEADPPVLPVMVPLADILNHVAKNNAALTFEMDALRMMSICDIKKGEEIFNTYGELSNKGLMHMYGFAQCYPDNHYDTVDVPVSVVTEVVDADCQDQQLLAAKLRFLQKQELHQSGESYVVGREGVLMDDELQAVLKVLVMSGEEFKEHEEKEGWSDDDDGDDDDEDTSPLSFEKMPDLPTRWKKILSRCGEVCLSRLAGDGEQDAKAVTLMAQPTSGDTTALPSSLSPRARHALHVRYGQRQLLQRLVDACR